jgi:hypothetical protein
MGAKRKDGPRKGEFHKAMSMGLIVSASELAIAIPV